MAFSAMLILYVMVLFLFAVTSVFMFKPKGNETVHIIFFWLAVALGVAVTFINATSLPSNMSLKIAAAWGGLLFTLAGVIVRIVKGKTNSVAKFLVMAGTVYGCISYFIF